MSVDVGNQRYLGLVEQLNREHGWELSSHTQRRYVDQMIACCSDIASKSDVQLRAMFEYYHGDHALVEALRNSAHPEHTDRWMEWTLRAIRIITKKSRGSYSLHETATSIDDLAQEAVLDIWRGLPSFSYQSSFHTWVFAVIGHCLARQQRARQAQKRSALPPPQSLDMLLMTGDIFPAQNAPAPDDIALTNMLAGLVRQVLELHPDRRLAIIFRLAVGEEQTLRTIGEQLHLSPPRVHALLKQAVALLRDELSLQDWVR
jgi:RNA polymerase sigma factor (sigma-70 family)